MKNRGVCINLSDLSMILYVIVSSGSFLRRGVCIGYWLHWFFGEMSSLSVLTTT